MFSQVLVLIPRARLWTLQAAAAVSNVFTAMQGILQWHLPSAVFVVCTAKAQNIDGLKFGEADTMSHIRCRGISFILGEIMYIIIHNLS